MRRLDHCNIVSLLYFFYTSGEKKVFYFSTSSILVERKRVKPLQSHIPSHEILGLLISLWLDCPQIHTVFLNLFGQRSVLSYWSANAITYFFYQDEIYLNLVLEYIPETVYKVHRTTICFTEFEVKIFGYAFAIIWQPYIIRSPSLRWRDNTASRSKPFQSPSSSFTCTNYSG